MARGTLTAFRAGRRCRFMAAVLIPVAAGLVSTVPGPQAEAAAVPAALTAAPACGALPVTAYVASDSAAVTPIATATDTAGAPIAVGQAPDDIAITPDGRTAYVADNGSAAVTPITTRADTAGPPIAVGANPFAIVITPVTGWPLVPFTIDTAIPGGRPDC